MKKILCWFVFAVLTLPMHAVLGQEFSPAFVLPSEEPMAILALPDGMRQNDVTLAVSKALVATEWQNLNWERNVTIATTVQSKITIKVFAVSTSADVKFYANYTSEKEVTEEKFKRLAQRQIGNLEKSVAESLKLTFKKSKDSIIDQAVAP